MITYIDWKLFNENKLLVCRKDEKAVYEDQNVLIYETKSEYNKIDLKKKKFLRKTDDLFMEIDFEKSVCKFDFEEIGTCKFDITCKFIVKKNIVNMIYKIDDEVKKVEITLKNIVL